MVQKGLEHSSTAFDTLDRPVNRFDSASFATHTQYDDVGNVTAITNSDGYTVRFEYDSTTTY
ncbi:MAG: RHS repeat protein [Gammaproteobacteria bacterium]|nr:RHS repeat protein [Gammaproteobacteria bacterium]